MAGWMHTGDMARFDEDGFLFLIGHKADILSCRLDQIYPTVLEQVLMDTKEVEDACMVGGNSRSTWKRFVSRKTKKHGEFYISLW